MLMERLAAWDKMAPKLQKEALEHELVVEYLSAPADQQDAVLKSLSIEQRAALNFRISQWRILPAVERARLNQRVGEFFKMEPEKQQQTLDNFSETERQGMQQTLQTFRGLTREQREVWHPIIRAVRQ